MTLPNGNRWGPAVVALCLLPLSAACAQEHQGPCAPDNAGLTLPDGFCAQIVANDIGAARHLVVAPNGDIFVAVAGGRGGSGGVVALRDTTGNGVADVTRRFAGGTGHGIALHGDYLYYATADAVMRFRLPPGALEPTGGPDTVIAGLPANGNHRTKTLVFGTDGALYVSMGSATNACQQQTRTRGSPGKDPCEELNVRAGIWRFNPDRLHQTESDGRRFATGMRNAVAFTRRPQDGALYAVIHGRDQLGQLWPDLFNDEQSAEKPAEEFVRVEESDDFGWPYCYYDPALHKKVLAPEYGGDGQKVGRCASKKDPLIGFPAHWAPDGLLFYQGTQFPARYRGGAFIAFHGSWNRAPLPQQGYNVVFAPFDGNEPTGKWDVFAKGFAGANPSPSAAHRPVGLAEGPDGSLYVSDDRGGTIYRIRYMR